MAEQVMTEENKQSLAQQLLRLVGPSEAEASQLRRPVGKAFKAASRSVLHYTESQTAKRLVNTEFMGQTIKNVLKGRGKIRYIVLDNDLVYPVTRDMVQDLVRSRGTTQKLAEFAAKEGESKITQAYKSLDYHVKRAGPFATQKILKDYHKLYNENLLAAGLEAPKVVTVAFQGKKFTMPSDYATLLQKEGVLKILKGMK